MTGRTLAYDAVIVGSSSGSPLLPATLPTSVDDALKLAIEIVGRDVYPAGGDTAALWSALATLAADDLQVARAVEPHLDAAAILQEAGPHANDAKRLGRTWGVFAAEGPGARLMAHQTGDGWTLNGTKPWCSLASVLDAALITAWVGDQRALFAVRLKQTGVDVDTDAWKARGLVDIPSGPVTFDHVQAIPVGDPGWYLSRPGFQWGGIGVAACWYGGAVGVARTVLRQARARPGSSLIDTHLGAIDEVLAAGSLALSDAANQIDRGTVADASLLASRARGVVARAVEEVLWRAGHALGPSPLATDADHVQRVADLQLYVRQHHAERDQESLGSAIRQVDDLPW